MHIAVDANILIADPTLQSQRLRVLWNYLERTRSRLVLLPSVELELAAHFLRYYQVQAEAVETAIRHAARHGVDGLPSFSAADSARQSFEKWERNFKHVLGAVAIDRPVLNGSILGEALRRATNRLPPCNDAGKEMRDTIHWLSLMEFSRALPADAQIAFISQNTRDFAVADGSALKPELAADAQDTGREITFFASVDSFNKVHADRIAYLTVEWVLEHLGRTPIEDLVAQHLAMVDPEPYLRIASSEYADYYEPRDTENVQSVSVELNDVCVWRTRPGELELGIEFSADVEAEVECALTTRPSRFWHREYNDDMDDEFPFNKTLSCYGELMGTVAARIIDDQEIEAVDLEQLERR